MEDSKVKILKMLESGLITVDEAKELLEASISGNDEKTSSQKTNETISKVKDTFNATKPKAKNFAISALEKIAEVSVSASKKLQQDTFEEDVDNKFFVVNAMSEEKSVIDNINVEKEDN